MLEDAGGLLDEAATLLGGGAQHGVELALADDDVHLAAEAGVGEQLLDVEQAAGRAVDGVLGAAAAEHRPRDRDLGVVDRQRAVGVVDGQGDLGPAERRAAGGAGEDDVLHLAAAQALGALLAHDPGQGVDDVGLAGAVGADDAGDARLEAQRRRRGEGLESLQGQRLEVHGSALSSGQARGRGHSTRGARRPADLAGSVVRGAPGADVTRAGVALGGLGDLLVVADDLGDDEGEERLGELRVEPGLVGERPQPGDLPLLAARGPRAAGRRRP